MWTQINKSVKALTKFSRLQKLLISFERLLEKVCESQKHCKNYGNCAMNSDSVCMLKIANKKIQIIE